jgi:hypothetical protein
VFVPYWIASPILFFAAPRLRLRLNFRREIYKLPKLPKDINPPSLLKEKTTEKQEVLERTNPLIFFDTTLTS